MNGSGTPVDILKLLLSHCLRGIVNRVKHTCRQPNISKWYPMNKDGLKKRKKGATSAPSVQQSTFCKGSHESSSWIRKNRISLRTSRADTGGSISFSFLTATFTRDKNIWEPMMSNSPRFRWYASLVALCSLPQALEQEFLVGSSPWCDSTRSADLVFRAV